jgi:tetratricopeptide (TPR) repeat protein
MSRGRDKGFIVTLRDAGPAARWTQLPLAVCLLAMFLASGCGSSEDRITSFFERGESYVENEEFEEAIIEFKNVLQIDPNHAGAHEALSKAYLEVQKPREAYWEMSETVRLDPTNIPALLRYGTVAATVGEHDVAIDQANAILAVEPGRAQAHLLRGQARLGLEDVDGAESDFLAAVASRPDGPAYRFLYASFLEQQGRKEEAVTAMRALVDLEPSYVALSGLGRLIASSEGGEVEAERLMRRAIEAALEAPKEAVVRDVDNADEIESLTPNIVYKDAVSGAYRLLAALLYTQDKFDESIAALEEGNSKLEGDTSLIYQMARLYAARGMTDKASELIFRATEEAAPDNAGPQLVLSSYLQSQGDLEGALEAAQTAVAIDAENLTASMRVAELQVDLGFRDSDRDAIDEGRKIVDRVIEESPTHPEANFVRGKIALAEGDPTAAEAALRTVLEVRPDWPQARFVLGSTLAMLGESGRARGEFARAVELDPAFADARRMLTRLHAELGEHEFAIEQGRQYLRQAPRDIAIRIIVGQSLIRVGRMQEAYDEVSKVPEEDRNAAALYALGRLDLVFGRKELAKERLLAANELSPDDPSILRSLLALDQDAGQLAASSKRIREANERSPSNSELAHLAGEVAMLEDDLEAAKESLEWAVELNAKNVAAQLSLAEVERRSGDDAAMLAVMQEAAAANPGSADLQYRLALVHETRGEKQEAAAAYERTLLADANFTAAKNNLAYMLAETPGGDLDRALALAQEAKEASPDDANAADTLGWVLLKRGAAGAAIGYLEEALERFPDEATELRGVVGNHLAEAYEQNEETSKAVAASQDVVAAYKKLSTRVAQGGGNLDEPEWARDARSRIERLGSAG